MSEPPIYFTTEHPRRPWEDIAEATGSALDAIAATVGVQRWRYPHETDRHLRSRIRDVMVAR